MPDLLTGIPAIAFAQERKYCSRCYQPIQDKDLICRACAIKVMPGKVKKKAAREKGMGS